MYSSFTSVRFIQTLYFFAQNINIIIETSNIEFIVIFDDVGDESLATELRVRTVIELAAFVDSYVKEYEADNFDELCGVSYDETISECAIDGGYASVWAVCGLASVIGRPIVSVYPKINGQSDILEKLLNRTLKPRQACDASQASISIMWTRASCHNPSHMWVSNHFVPLVEVYSVPQSSPYSSTSSSIPSSPVYSTPLQHNTIETETASQNNDISWSACHMSNINTEDTDM